MGEGLPHQDREEQQNDRYWPKAAAHEKDNPEVLTQIDEEKKMDLEAFA